MTGDSDVWFVGSVFGSVGGLLVGIAILLLIRTRAFLRRAHDAKAIVIRLVRKVDGREETWAPVYQFRTRDGQTIEVEDTLSNYAAAVRGEPGRRRALRSRRSARRACQEVPCTYLPRILGGLGVLLLGAALGVLLLFG